MTNTISKKLTAGLLALMVAFTFMPVLDTANAAAKPAKVTGVKWSIKGTTATVTWKKAKRATKYQVWLLQSNAKSKKYKKIKTTKARKYIKKGIKPGVAYRFKIRAIRGKKVGSFSAVKRVYKGVVHTAKISQLPKKAVVGDTYTLKSGVKVKVTKIEDGTIYGKTATGGSFEQFQDGYHIEEKAGLVDINWSFDNKVISDIFQIIIKDAGVTVYWTIDGTEPKVGQADKTGTSPYVHFNQGKDYQTQLRGTFTGKKTHGILTGDRLLGGKQCIWFKAYKGGKLVKEDKFVWK